MSRSSVEWHNLSLFLPQQSCFLCRVAALVTRVAFPLTTFLRLGFLDGMPGFHVCAYTAFYTFMKQARLWELHHARQKPDPEAELSGDGRDVIPFGADGHADSQQERELRAA